MSPAKLQTAVVGATGYSGFELACLLYRHPHLRPPVLLQRDTHGDEQRFLADFYPRICGNGSLPLKPFSWAKLAEDGVDLLFLATPHDISRQWVPEALRRGLRVIDLSGAWRLKCAQHRQVYGFNDGDPDEAAKADSFAVYGLPELHAEKLRDAQLVANPGCYATSIILALAPLMRAGLIAIEQGVVCDSKSGVSGAGKEPTSRTHFVEVADNLSAYSVFEHRHTGEIIEQLGIAGSQLTFTPHLVPIPRGILSTIYARLRSPEDAEKIEPCLRAFYRDKPWVRVFKNSKLPQIQFSVHTNFCDIGACVSPDGGRLVLVSCLDNLVKGAAGQAVQNMNLMCGWDEKEGLN
ncbi:MAG: N-acetyl-gamma-glutamyl-phosphate reductase [Acidobacteria bacterium]|nr:N-acetyl-gamma-glutamyl-phosphate reductase [Acidobacteriota bacterium]